MSDYQARSIANDMSDPSNHPEWDGEWDCPECSDHTGNMVKHDEPLKDCLDHIEDGDLREHMRASKTYLDERIKNQLDIIKASERKVAARDGQIDAIMLSMAKKDGQIEELIAAMEVLKEMIS